MIVFDIRGSIVLSNEGKPATTYNYLKGVVEGMHMDLKRK